MSNQKTGREVAEDLAKTIQLSGGWMVWTNMPLGSVQHSNPGIADVLAISKSYNTCARIYEVKISRGDFWADVNEGKYRKYLQSCNQFLFATEAGLVKVGELPEDCGLITKGDKGWHVQKAARRRDCELSTEFLLALLMRGFQDYWQARPGFNKDKEWFEYKGLSDAAYKYGKKYAADLARGQEYLRGAAELQKKIDQALGQQHNGLANSLWHLQAEIERLLGKYKYAQEIAELTDILMRIFKGQNYRVSEELQQVADRLKAKLTTPQRNEEELH